MAPARASLRWQRVSRHIPFTARQTKRLANRTKYHPDSYTWLARDMAVTISVTVSLQVVALSDQMMMNCTCPIDSVPYRRKEAAMFDTWT